MQGGNWIKLGLSKAAGGFFTFLGEIILVLGILLFVKSGMLNIAVLGIFFIILGQMASLSAIKYENRKRLIMFLDIYLEEVGKLFAYPLLMFGLYLLNGEKLFLVIAFALTISTLIKTAFLIYKAQIINNYE